MKSPTADDARAMSSAILKAQLSQNFHDLLSWASEPLKQRVHFLRTEDDSNLEELLGLWDHRHHFSSPPCSSFSTNTAKTPTTQKVLEFLQQQHGSPPCSRPSAVYQKQLDANTTQALVPLGDFTVQEFLMVALMSENDLSGLDPKWKYHGLVVISKQSLSKEGWRVITENESHRWPALGLSSYDSPQPCSTLHLTDEEDDDDDDYWGQYGEPDDVVKTVSSVGSAPTDTEVSNPHAEFRRTRLPETDGEAEGEDDYWHKYTDFQEEQHLAKLSEKQEQAHQNEGTMMTDSAYHETYSSELSSSSSPPSGPHIGNRRVLASLDIAKGGYTLKETSVDRLGHPDTSLTSPVDPLTLSMLLERLSKTTTMVVRDNRLGLSCCDDEEDNALGEEQGAFFVGNEEVEVEEEKDESLEELGLSTLAGSQSLSNESQKQEQQEQQEQDQQQQKEEIHCQQLLHEGDNNKHESQNLILHSSPQEITSDILNGLPNLIAESTSTVTTIASITPLDSPSPLSPLCRRTMTGSCCYTAEEDLEMPSFSAKSCILLPNEHRARILEALKNLVSEASSHGLNQRDLLVMLNECFS
ncbi:hypothetical protein BGZ83_005142 [Gryganskiella cystojenkinii]|nr:hypothetical protein BGZ83_005142 [Gryganskiella cystojenkinii]